MPLHTSCDTAGHGILASPANPDDELLAAVLIRMWTLASGRSLRRDVPPAELREDELISFWADDMSEPAGRHALPGEPDRAARSPVTARTGRSARQTRSKNRRASPSRITGSRRERPLDPAAA